MSSGVERSVEIGCAESGESCLFKTVVISSRGSAAGRRERMVAYRVEIGAVAGVGSERVRGKPRPAKVAIRMLTVGVGSIVCMIVVGFVVHRG